MDFSQRHEIREWMETETVTTEDFAACLGDLASVNTLTLTYRPTLAFLRRATRGLAPGSVLSVLDVGSGHGDMLRRIAGWALRHGFKPELTGIDLDPSSEIAARAATLPTLPITYLTGDIFAYRPVTEPDFIISSLVTHHMSDAQIVAFLDWMQRSARRAWFVNDLHRAAVPYWVFRMGARLMGWHRFVVHDGPVSILRAFKPEDWRRLLAEAGVEGTIERWFPYRLCVSHLPGAGPD